MQIFRSRTAAGLAAAAALSLAAAPAMARDWHRHRDGGIDAGDVFAGVLIVGGIAAIAAAASKASKDRRARPHEPLRDDDYRGDDYRDDGYRADDDTPPLAPFAESAPTIGYGDVAPDDAYAERALSGYGVAAAVDTCVAEVARADRRVETIDGVNREGEGWRVGGRVTGNYGFSCLIDGKGRVQSVEGL